MIYFIFYLFFFSVCLITCYTAYHIANGYHAYPIPKAQMLSSLKNFLDYVLIILHCNITVLDSILYSRAIHIVQRLQPKQYHIQFTFFLFATAVSVA